MRFQTVSTTEVSKYIQLMHMHRQDFDLIVQLIDLASTRDLSGFELRKICSHQSNDDATDDLQLYSILGNRWDDEEAKSSVQQHRSDVQKLAWEVGKWYIDQISHLQPYTGFLVATGMKRLEAFEKFQHIDDGKSLTASLATSWDPVSQRKLLDDTPIPDEFLAGFLPGASFYLALICFA